MAILTPKSPDVRTGHDPRPREWRPPHLIWLAVAAVAAFVVVFWAALGRAPLSGTNVVAMLGFAFVALANLSLGALACGAVIEARHPLEPAARHRSCVHVPGAGRAGRGGRRVRLVAVQLGRGGLVRWLFLVIALAALAGGVWWSWPRLLLPGRRRACGSKSRWGLWPQHADASGDETWHLFTPLTVLLGAALGVMVAVAYLGISAWHENANSPAGHPLPALLTGIHGGYVALGDSYSAGEGLPRSPPAPPRPAATVR
jgi:hypothetical protein